MDSDRFSSEASTLVFGKPDGAALGVGHFMCVPGKDLAKLRAGGIEAVVNEITEHGTEEDKECLAYILDEEAGSSDKTFQGGLKRDCDRNGDVFPERLVADGNGGTRGMRFADFVAHAHAADNLDEEHVLALRMYSTIIFRSINAPMRDQGRHKRGEPHPLPVTVALLEEGVSRLRAVEGKTATANEPLDLWRGMRDATVAEQFLLQGGTELAPMSTYPPPPAPNPDPEVLARAPIGCTLDPQTRKAGPEVIGGTGSLESLKHETPEPETRPPKSGRPTCRLPWTTA